MPKNIVYTDALKVKRWVSTLEELTAVPVKEIQACVVEFFVVDSPVNKISVNYLNKIYRDHGENVFVVGISLDAQIPTDKYTKVYAPEYLIGQDQDGDLNLQLLEHITQDFIPVTVVLNYGHVVYLGSSTHPDLIETVRRLEEEFESGPSNGRVGFQV